MNESTQQALSRAIQIVGSQAELARRIGKKQAYVWNWLHRDKQIPAECAVPIELATDGSVTRYELRPDVFGEPPSTDRKRARVK